MLICVCRPGRMARISSAPLNPLLTAPTPSRPARIRPVRRRPGPRELPVGRQSRVTLRLVDLTVHFFRTRPRRREKFLDRIYTGSRPASPAASTGRLFQRPSGPECETAPSRIHRDGRMGARRGVPFIRLPPTHPRRCPRPAPGQPVGPADRPRPARLGLDGARRSRSLAKALAKGGQSRGSQHLVSHARVADAHLDRLGCVGDESPARGGRRRVHPALRSEPRGRQGITRNAVLIP